MTWQQVVVVDDDNDVGSTFQSVHLDIKQILITLKYMYFVMKV